MKLYIKQKVFSFADSFTVKDETGADWFTVKGEFFALNKRLHIYDMYGQEIASIVQKLFSLMPRYFVQIQGQDVCQIAQRFTFLKPYYELEGLPYSIKGDFLAREYTISAQDHVIMQVSKHWFTWGDSYELNIPNPDDALLGLCCVLAIDASLAQSAAASNNITIS